MSNNEHSANLAIQPGKGLGLNYGESKREQPPEHKNGMNAAVHTIRHRALTRPFQG